MSCRQTSVTMSYRKTSMSRCKTCQATDTANDEQLSISIRFVDCGSPCERFLTFPECRSGVSGEAIADDILA